MAKMRLKLPNISIVKLFLWIVTFPTFMVFISVATMHKDSREYKVTDEVFMDVSIDDKSQGRVVFGLFGDDVPRTVTNFITFATTGYAGYKYEGSSFHRVIKRFMVQGGDVVSGNGQGTISIFGMTFPDENLELRHGRAGFISMANKGKDSNGCQFFITTIATPWLDGQHVIFGKVIEGMDVVNVMENVATDYSDRPIKKITITKSGKRRLSDHYYITDDPYNLKDWVKTISVPLSFSFGIILLFNYFMKKLDSHIIEDDGSMDDDETIERKKKALEEEEKKIKEEEEKKMLLENEEGDSGEVVEGQKEEEERKENETKVRKRTMKAEK